MLIEKKTSNGYSKFTFTGTGEIRVKVPVNATNERAMYAVHKAEDISSRYGPFTKTFRGRLKQGEIELTLYSDSKKESMLITLPEPWPFGEEELR